MREEPCKTYGHLFPADQHIADAVGAALSDWNIPECTELEGDIFRISFEGVFFPLDDVLDALRPYLRPERQAKLDRAKQLAGLSRPARQAWRLWKEGELHL